MSNSMSDRTDITFRMNASLVDMEDLGCPGEWQMRMQAGIDEIRRLRTALRSIAANTCCGSCQEAALVAKKALDVNP
jgi:hypothetical protein